MDQGSSNNNEIFDADSHKEIEGNIVKEINEILTNFSHLIQDNQLSQNEDGQRYAVLENLSLLKMEQKQLKSGKNLKKVENVIKLDKIKSYNDIQMIENSFKSHFVFCNLTQQEIDQIIKNLVFCTQKKDQFIFQQGDQLILILQQSKDKLKLQSMKKKLKSKQKENIVKKFPYYTNQALSKYFCQLILPKTKHFTSVSTIIDASLFLFSYKAYSSKLSSGPIVFIYFNPLKTPTVPDLITQQESAQSSSFTMVSPGSNLVLINAFIIESLYKGVLQEKKVTSFIKFLFHHTLLSYIFNCFSKGFFIQHPKITVSQIDRKFDILIVLIEVFLVVYLQQYYEIEFCKNQYLELINKTKIRKIILKAQIQNQKKNKLYFKKILNVNNQQQFLKELYKVMKRRQVEYLSQNKKNDMLQSEYIVVTDGGDIETAIQKKIEVKINNIANKADASHIHFQDLIFIKKLRDGQIGQFYTVKHKDNNNCYILKSLSKASIIQECSKKKYLLQEQRILELCNFPFIMQFARIYKDEFSVFLSQYIRGMELFDVIREIGLLNKEQTQFYIGTIILCLEYLHSNGIIYRNLKPENIMVNSDGIMMLIDFGYSKQITKVQEQMTYTIICTPHYMAPEIILGKGYSYNVDLWSVGICCYEIQCGGVPYGYLIDDPYVLYDEIMNTQLDYPNFIKDTQAKSYIEQLLSKQTEARLGSQYAGLKGHAWFEDFEWDKQYNNQLQPPVCIDVKLLVCSTQEQIDQ